MTQEDWEKMMRLLLTIAYSWPMVLLWVTIILIMLFIYFAATNPKEERPAALSVLALGTIYILGAGLFYFL